MAALCLVALQACQENETPAANVIASGTCGEEGDGSNLMWRLTDKGTLIINGKGAMKDYDYHYYNDDDASFPSWVEHIKDISAVVIQNGVTSIGNNAFSDCVFLETATIPSSVTSIGDCAFSTCVILKTVTIPGSVTSIGDSAFEYCERLSSVTILDGVVSIGGAAFWGCTNLITITIPNGVTNIGYRTFEDCKSLTSITIPYGVTNIEHSAFYGCTGLEEIKVEAAMPPAFELEDHTFYDVNPSIPVYVPANSVEDYRNSPWGQVFSNIQPM